jgi:hypothetical protein
LIPAPGATCAAGSATPAPGTSTSKMRALPSVAPATIQRPSGDTAQRIRGRAAAAAAALTLSAVLVLPERNAHNRQPVQLSLRDCQTNCWNTPPLNPAYHTYKLRSSEWTNGNKAREWTPDAHWHRDTVVSPNRSGAHCNAVRSHSLEVCQG